ncbi:DnaT-like ssDNA-binding protein, partial [Eikenella corrodens]|uniref:DnaT-like ssDNA-binding protein n=1 Tax=Eikenella corrodens TaxID=539 RepID=UPI003B97A714
MALNVPADSYVGVADADRYHQMRQSASAWAALDEPTKERMLVSASDYLDANFRLK